MSYKNKKIFDMTQEEFDEYMNSEDGIEFLTGLDELLERKEKESSDNNVKKDEI